jgi:hypothetical protein
MKKDGSDGILFGNGRQGRQSIIGGLGSGKRRQVAGIRVKRREGGLVSSGKRRQITGT